MNWELLRAGRVLYSIVALSIIRSCAKLPSHYYREIAIKNLQSALSKLSLILSMINLTIILITQMDLSRRNIFIIFYKFLIEFVNS